MEKIIEVATDKGFLNGVFIGVLLVWFIIKLHISMVYNKIKYGEVDG